MKFAVACLIGAASASVEYIVPEYNTHDAAPVWGLRSVNANAANAVEQKAYGDFSAKTSNEKFKEWTHVQLESDSSDSEELAQLNDDDKEESDHSKEFYVPWDSVPDDIEGYHRVIPAQFTDAGDDLFMRSMIKQYALEGKNKDGSPNGNFQMDEAATRAAASEVLETHKGLKGDEKKKYLDQYFARTFAHFDVTKEGKIDVIKMPQFMRFLASDQYMSLQN